jgi:hypothetical protein
MERIPFTQYLLPDGRTRPTAFDAPDDVAARARAIIAAGHRFECEVLTTGEVSLTIHDVENGEDLAIEVVPNGPEVPEAVVRLVESFDA